VAQPATRVVQFGLFELDLDARELRKSGVRLKLQEQPFQILAMLLERPGEIVTREELQKRLWPQDTFVDFDLSLNSAVKRLRQALGDDSENPRFIETLYRRGYRFMGPVTGRAAASEPIPVLSIPLQARANSESLLTRAGVRNFRTLVWLFPVVLVLAGLLLWLKGSSSPPRIIGYTQITSGSVRKGNIVTDGERLYFSQLQGDHFVVAQVSVRGGETSFLSIPFADVYAPDIAGDSSTLLIADFELPVEEGRLWSLPLPAGSPQRLGDSSAHAATWSRDRNEVVFARGSDVYTADGNGSQPRKLASLNGPAFGLRFSPDGRRLRFEVHDPKSGSSALWEMNRDGTHLQTLLSGWSKSPRECCGNWSPDGKYYVFQSLREGKTNLWLLPAQTRWFGAQGKAQRLTNGPLDFSFPVFSKDGKKIFAVGSQPRSEPVRYDGRSDFSPYLGGISATDLAFSSDNQSVTYISVPEGTLWRTKVDGTQRIQLTQPPLQAALPRWSPDGTQIAFMGRTTNTNWRAYLIASEGGVAHELVPDAQAGFDPGWSPDGKSVVVTLNDSVSPGISISGPGIAIVDLQTRKVSPLPGAAQLFSPRWSPDGKLIAAISNDSQKLVLFDVVTKRWTELVNTPIAYPSWSHDGKYLYFVTNVPDDPAFFRLRISDHKLERLASLKGLQRFYTDLGSWTGLAPDDSLMLVRDTSSQEIYALDLR
jgi:Tol biopolymer transport system component/DNA-binding winged helix-turn-helix (wHTH) protein